MRAVASARGAGWVVIAALCSAGCASQGIVVHRMPPDTPAADNATAIEKAQALATAEHFTQNGDEPVAPLTAADAPSVRTYDPWERLNRFTYRFNARFDEALFLPVANGYRRVPAPLRSGVHHFFGNLAEVDSIVNYTLQGRIRRGARSLGRFLINSTLGIGGLFEVASKFHIDEAPTGFGTTLSQWGMHPGPYFVIPLIGPSTLREAVGLLGDYATSYGINLANLYRGDQSWGIGVVNAVDQRAHIDFRYYSTGSPFEYENIRFLYVRKLLLEDAGLHRKEPRVPVPKDVPAGQ